MKILKIKYNKTKVYSALSKCFCYVLLSHHEGTPRTILEALSVGRPIITTDAPGCRETVVNGYNGFMVNINDYVLFKFDYNLQTGRLSTRILIPLEKTTKPEITLNQTLTKISLIINVFSLLI